MSRCVVDPHIKELEDGLASLFRDQCEQGLQRGFGVVDPQLICRAMLRATYAFAFEHLEHHDAVKALAAALNDLNAEHAKRMEPGD